jgi:hypothetical protein
MKGCVNEAKCPVGGWVHPGCDEDLAKLTKEQIDLLDFFCKECRKLNNKTEEILPKNEGEGMEQYNVKEADLEFGENRNIYALQSEVELIGERNGVIYYGPNDTENTPFDERIVLAQKDIQNHNS